MELWPKILLLVGLTVGLALFSAYLVRRTFEEVKKGLKVALKAEVGSNSGRLNLAGAFIFLFLIIFTSLDKTLVDALITERSASSDGRVLVPLLLFLLLFFGSLLWCWLMAREGAERED